MRRDWYFALAFSFFSLLVTAPLLAATLPEVLGRVEGQAVTRKQVQAILNRWTFLDPLSFQNMDDDEKREITTQLVDHLIARRLLLREALRESSQPSKRDVAEEYRRSQENFLLSWSLRGAFLEGHVRVELSGADARDSLLIKKLEEKLINGIIIFPSEIQEYWEKNRDIFLEVEKKERASLEDYRERIVTALRRERWKELEVRWVSTLKAKARIWNYFDGEVPTPLSTDQIEKLRHREGVVAAVNGEPITLSELEERAGTVSTMGRKRKELLNHALEGIVEERLLLAEAKRMGIGVSQKDFDERLRRFQAKLPSPEAFINMMRSSGIDIEKWKKAKADALLVEEVESRRMAERMANQPDPLLRQKKWSESGRRDWLASLRRKARIWYNFPSLVPVGSKAPLNIQGPAVVDFGRTGLSQSIQDANIGVLPFIHIDPEKEPGIVDQWGLELEPWVFILDDKSVVRASLPGRLSPRNLKEEIQRLSGSLTKR